MTVKCSYDPCEDCITYMEQQQQKAQYILLTVSVEDGREQWKSVFLRTFKWSMYFSWLHFYVEK